MAARDPRPAAAPDPGRAETADPGRAETADDAPFFASVVLPQRVARTVSAADIERSGGMAIDETNAMWEAFGLPAPEPETPAFTPDEADALVKVADLEDLWPADLRRGVSRVYGIALAQIARSEIHGFREHTVPRVRERSGGSGEELGVLRAVLEQLLPLADPLLLGIHRRWVEHELAQAAVGAAERRSGAEPLPGATDVSFLFCDLKDFTAYAEREGDGHAVAAIDSFFACVEHERGDGGRLVKALGDGAMLAYDEPDAAVDAGARMITAMQSTDLPRVHASVHCGRAVVRHGDYFGGAVNLAARLLAIGGRDELIASHDVVSACGGREWEPIGQRRIRGLDHAIDVFRLVLD